MPTVNKEGLGSEARALGSNWASAHLVNAIQELRSAEGAKEVMRTGATKIRLASILIWKPNANWTFNDVRAKQGMRRAPLRALIP